MLDARGRSGRVSYAQIYAVGLFDTFFLTLSSAEK